MNAREIEKWLAAWVPQRTFDATWGTTHSVDREIAKHVVRVWELVDQIDMARGRERDLLVERLLGEHFGELRTSLDILKTRAHANDTDVAYRRAKAVTGPT